MKRFAIFLLLGLFLSIGRAEAYDLQTYVSVSSTGERSDTAVSTSTIIPGKCWVLGYRVTGNNILCLDPTVELYDAATTGTMSDSNKFDSLEADTSPLRSDGDWYPGGKKLSNGLAIRRGGYTTVTIFYEQRIH